MAKAAETTGAVADLIRLVSAAATSERYSIASKMSALYAAAMTAETGETTTMAKAGGTTAMDSHGRRRRRRRRLQSSGGGTHCIPTVGMYCSFYVETRSFLNVQKNNIDLH